MLLNHVSPPLFPKLRLRSVLRNSSGARTSMRGCYRRLLLGTLSLGMFTSTPAFAQEDRNEILMQKLHSKLENVLGVADYGSGRAADSLVLAMPGYVLDPTVNLSSPEGRRALFGVMDRTLQPSWYLRFSEGDTSQIYRAILGTRELPQITPTQAERDQLRRAQRIIFADIATRRPSQRFKDFQRTRTALSHALDTVQDWQRANPVQAVPALMIDTLQRAQEEFELIGDKDVILAAQSIINATENIDGTAYWGRLQAQYNANLTPVGGAQVPTYEFFPTTSAWLNDSLRWTRVTLSDSDLNQTTTSSRSSWGGKIGGRWKLWGARGSYGQTEARTSLDLDAETLNITFEVLRVSVERPWMDSSVFGSKAWRWRYGAQPYYGRQISEGEAWGADPPRGVAPMLPTELILARNVTLTGNWNSELRTTYMRERSNGARVSWGPFSLGGGGSSSYNEAADRVKVTGNTITSPEVQIIGVLVDVLPRTPDPDPALKWPMSQPLNVKDLTLRSVARVEFEAEKASTNALSNAAARLLKKNR